MDLLDVAVALLPSDGYCVLAFTHHNIYEGEIGLQPGTLRGRAFGGSRIACFSTAHLHRTVNALGW